MFENVYFLLSAPEGGAAGSGGGLTTLLPFVLIFLVMYLLIIRPQSAKQKKLKKMLAEMGKGDKVITIGGIHGTIAVVNKKTVTVKVDDNTKMEFNKESIATILGENEPVKETPKKKESKSTEIKSEETK